MYMKPPVILNSAGKPIVLDEHQRHQVSWLANTLKSRYGKNPLTPFINSLGYDVAITTLTSISAKITEQKFYTLPFAEYLPVKVGQNSYSDQITTFRSFDVAGEFEEGIVNTGADNSRLASADAAIDALNIKVFPWAKGSTWTIFDMEYAAKFGNWDKVEAQEKARKRNWDLGLQRIAFLGANGLNGSGGACLGLLTQPGVNTNTTVITKAINTMTTAELKAFTAAVIEAYRANCQRTAYPDSFIVPESDYNGMAATVSPDFPIKTILELLEEMFKTITMNPQFKIRPLAYADAVNHVGIVPISGKQVYMLTRYDEESIRMDIPLDYTTTLANSDNNFAFQNAGFGQFTGVLAYRPLEHLYFTY